MIHIRVDNEAENNKRKFACGIGPDLPPEDTYFFADEASAMRADCPGCNPKGPYHQLDIPINQLSGKPGFPGYEQFKRLGGIRENSCSL